MLKIKDNVDLKELEKFGFKKVNDFYIRKYHQEDNIKYYKEYFIRIRNMPKYAYYKEIQDCARDKLGFTHVNYDNIDVEKEIDDLIKADLVEKVEE